ncbi:MAG: hypothetical protein WA902_07970 [Thermosynechococcaceae cyanobacterium]
MIGFPWLALPLYWILGRWKFQGYAEAYAEVYRQHAKQAQAVYQELTQHEVEPSAPWDSLHHLAQSLTEIAFTTDNAIQLLCDGEQTFRAMLQALAQAQHYIFLQTYILKNDQIGLQFQQALIERAQQGVHIYPLYDAIGSRRLPKHYLQQLWSHGIHVAAFRSTRG